MQHGGATDFNEPYWALGASQFGKRVRAQREGAGLTQRELSEILAELGVKLDTSAITRIENGSREPRLKEAAAIAYALGISLTALLQTDEGPMSALFSAYTAMDIAAQELDRTAERAYSALDAFQSVIIRSDVKNEVAEQVPTLDLNTIVDRCSDAMEHFGDVYTLTSMLNRIADEIERIPGFAIEPVPELRFDAPET
jgi:transcriptional regulator with XRE-family HTH domain